MTNGSGQNTGGAPAGQPSAPSEAVVRAFEAAVALHQRGQLAEAIAGYQGVLQERPDLPQAHNNLGACLWATGRLEEAAAAYRQAVGLAPKYATAQANLGSALSDLGRPQEGVGHFLQAVSLAPGNVTHWQGLTLALRRLRFSQTYPDLSAAIEDCFNQDGVTHQLLVTPSLSLLENELPVRRALDLAAAGDAATLGLELTSDPLRGLLRNSLLQAVMTKAIVPDEGFERLLTTIRRLCLEAVTAPGGAPLAGLLESETGFLAALACQCFATDYAYEETPEEAAAVDRLQAGLAAAAASASDKLSPHTLVYAMYRPLHGLDGAEGLARTLAPSDPVCALLVRRQLTEPLQEREIANGLTELTPIEHPVSAAVQSQYEEHPYPRWQSVWVKAPAPLASVVQGLFPHLARLEESPRPTRVLIAGCGSGQAVAIVAMRYAEAEILAVDLSRRALAFAVRRAQELGIPNVTFGQADILQLEGLGQRFHVIESIGVLHHLADPMRGWRNLVELTEPGGFLRLGLYSRTGRRNFRAARALLQAQGFPATESGIRAARGAIRALDPGDPARQVMDELDFYSLTGCRDFLFNVQEVAYDLPEIGAMVRDLGLEFLGFEFADPLIKQAYARRFPADTTMTDLASWEIFEAENPDTFSGVYLFWCRKP